MNAHTSNYSYAINGDIRFYLHNSLEPAQHSSCYFFKNADLNASYNIVQSEMTYTVSSGTLNSSIPYHTEKLGRLKSYTAGVITVTSPPPHQHASQLNLSSHREPSTR